MMTIVALNILARKAIGVAQALNFLLLVQRVRLGQRKTCKRKLTAVSVQQGSFAHRQLWCRPQCARQGRTAHQEHLSQFNARTERTVLRQA